MDSPAAILAARLRHSKHLQLNHNAHSCHQRQYPCRLVVPLGWATAPLDTGGRGWAVACLTTLYDIAISRYTGLRYRDTIFSHNTSPKINCIKWLLQCSQCSLHGQCSNSDSSNNIHHFIVHMQLCKNVFIYINNKQIYLIYFLHFYFTIRVRIVH